MKKLNIGITVDLSVSLFSSGINQNAIYLAEVYREIGWNPILISNGEDGRASKELNIFGLDHLEIIDINDLDSTRWDILITLGVAILPARLIPLRKVNPNLRLIEYKCGNQLFVTSEIILHGAHEKRKAKSSIPTVPPKADAIWVIPQMENTNLHFYEYLNGSNNIATVVPFIWDPMVVEASSKFAKFPNWEPRETKRVSITEPNLGLMKNVIIPTVICSRALDCDIEIDSIHAWSTKKLSENIDLIKFIREGNKDLLTKFKALDRLPITSVLSNSDYVLSWQLENNLNYVYFDTAWLGYPIIHNANLCQDIGYYYPNSDAEEGVKQLKNAMDNHTTDYLERSRNSIRRYTKENPELVEAYKKLTLEVLDGKSNRYKYNWQTNTINI